MTSAKGTREIRLLKLSLPYEKGDEPLSDKEVLQLQHRGIIRTAHYLWLAEQYMMDLSKLNLPESLDSHLENLSRASACIEMHLNRIMSNQ